MAAKKKVVKKKVVARKPVKKTTATKHAIQKTIATLRKEAAALELFVASLDLVVEVPITRKKPVKKRAIKKVVKKRTAKKAVKKRR